MRRRDHHIYGKRQALEALADEYRWIGRAPRLRDDHLVVLAVNPDDLDPNKNRKRFA